ncbi:MAG: RNA methyltransferase [Flavobacterium sp.]|nr:RNA methyltransferase [Flavobacterium sp.]
MLSKNQIKLITSLQQKKYRKQHQLFFAEGIKVIEELLVSKFELQAIYTTELLDFDVATDKIHTINTNELKKISALTTPNTCLAVFKIPMEKKLEENGLIVALDNVRDPGNLGTIIRLCDWFGITQLICSTETVDIYNPKVVQATMGSIGRVAVFYQDLAAFLKETQLPVFGTFMEGENVYQKSLPQNGILVMGNEANGISESVSKSITQKLSIPRFGKLQQTESLNVATATAILLSEFKRNN